MNSIDFGSFQAVFQWVIAHGYPLMFLAMCIEGPTVTAAATFAATLGYFNPLVIFFLSILGDVIPDMLYYAIGYWGRLKIVKKFGHKFGLNEDRIERMEKGIKSHGIRTVAVLKYTPVLATPGLMLVGAMKMPLVRFFWIVLLVTLQKTLTFMVLGYFFGQAYNIGKYIKYGAIIPFFIIIAYFVFAFLYKKFSERFIKKIDRL